ncbi:hypothetical protein RHECNPAF_890064 [Rhizobium etli CNPAF512]|nr:hypothetical protein RHECNPAF_890064 [Rhizobium etli CNPAF512]
MSTLSRYNRLFPGGVSLSPPGRRRRQ